MTRKVAIGADHIGFPIHESIVRYVREAGEEFEPVYIGPHSLERVDYPDYALNVARMVARGEADVGILVCGSGIGMSIAANKVPGIRAALCFDHYTAVMARQHNDANVVCLGERTTGPAVLREIIMTFLQTPYSGEDRHTQRLEKIKAAESNTNGC
ncbi:ribose 5-phosphate isomerase, putative [Trypanosoma equiperdum]|uniref:Ribose 5-phosphate isomerase, putative n=3 Tax=Trypanozoon TaxID=39700 RepID=Q384D1_TRYB2|nr:ribose 5-phosphate isomerase, putative [Trypanosoma brucei gambiense DAL972]XP_828962.1 ribose 5-phosphate isomerase, putative [Trypanosoma brucei brucei TREU927]EAN79850.1 ribose 5-phosphate isomerase, putative [Trypanosoma brucei brucei TREU927]CBH17884.1 ribose 5-phosphate isomerase, putative [Trypanosoma brucei gambiense DAL972]SCU71460.1 ribose 5-phosphate isomerase, putative [Trypanosoma equiperdum]|eukprot:XP_011780148.1 ribose 5-phosphate isomerase, putative [Trypanosoma brucei gambiense DAL972]